MSVDHTASGLNKYFTREELKQEVHEAAKLYLIEENWNVEFSEESDLSDPHVSFGACCKPKEGRCWFSHDSASKHNSSVMGIYYAGASPASRALCSVVIQHLAKKYEGFVWSDIEPEVTYHFDKTTNQWVKKVDEDINTGLSSSL